MGQGRCLFVKMDPSLGSGKWGRRYWWFCAADANRYFPTTTCGGHHEMTTYGTVRHKWVRGPPRNLNEDSFRSRTCICGWSSYHSFTCLSPLWMQVLVVVLMRMWSSGTSYSSSLVCRYKTTTRTQTTRMMNTKSQNSTRELLLFAHFAFSMLLECTVDLRTFHQIEWK